MTHEDRSLSRALEVLVFMPVNGLDACSRVDAEALDAVELLLGAVSARGRWRDGLSGGAEGTTRKERIKVWPAEKQALHCTWSDILF